MGQVAYWPTIDRVFLPDKLNALRSAIFSDKSLFNVSREDESCFVALTVLSYLKENVIIDVL